MPAKKVKPVNVKPLPDGSESSAYPGKLIAGNNAYFDNSDYRIKRLESIIENEMQSREVQRAYDEGLKDGAASNFWVHFALGAAYGIVLLLMYGFRKVPKVADIAKVVAG